MLRRRGQVTMFVLIGLGILLFVLLLLFLRDALRGRPAIDGYDTTTVNDYVSRCIDLVSEDAFLTLGRQGFIGQAASAEVMMDGLPIPVVIGLAQEGPSPARPPLGDEFLQTQAALYDPELENPYPWPGLPILDIYTDGGSPLSPWYPPQYDGPFGQFTMPKLCLANGPNRLGSADPCPPLLYGAAEDDPPPLQSSLALLIEAGLGECIDEGQLGILLSSTVELTPPNVTITYTQRETIVAAQVPLTFSNEEGTLRTATFTRRYPVRILATGRFLFHLLKRASKDPLFQVDEITDYGTLPGYDAFVVTKQRHEGRFLVGVTDPRSTVDGDRWTVRFLIENRAPIINLGPLGDSESDAILLDYEYDDPDGDPVTIRFQVIDESVSSRTAYMDVLLNGEPPEAVSIGQNVPTGPYLAILTATDTSGASDWVAFRFEKYDLE